MLPAAHGWHAFAPGTLLNVLAGQGQQFCAPHSLAYCPGGLQQVARWRQHQQGATACSSPPQQQQRDHQRQPSVRPPSSPSSALPCHRVGAGAFLWSRSAWLAQLAQGAARLRPAAWRALPALCADSSITTVRTRRTLRNEYAGRARQVCALAKACLPAPLPSSAAAAVPAMSSPARRTRRHSSIPGLAAHWPPGLRMHLHGSSETEGAGTNGSTLAVLAGFSSRALTMLCRS